MDIVEIRQRAEKATPGPWSLQPAEWECDCGGDEDGHAHKAPDQCRDGWWRDAAWVAGPILIEHGDGWTGFNDADADFMAHARKDVPALCDALEAAEAAVDVLLKPVIVDWMALRAYIGDSDETQGAMIAVAQTIAQATQRAEAAEKALAIMADDLASMTVRAQIAEDGRQIETRRAERALDTLARYEQQQWMARAIGAEAAEERMLTERVQRRIEGTLPADDLRRAFVDGAAWWEFRSTEFTMWNSDRAEAEAEAEARFPNGKPRAIEVTP